MPWSPCCQHESRRSKRSGLLDRVAGLTGPAALAVQEVSAPVLPPRRRVRTRSRRGSSAATVPAKRSARPAPKLSAIPTCVRLALPVAGRTLTSCCCRVAAPRTRRVRAVAPSTDCCRSWGYCRGGVAPASVASTASSGHVPTYRFSEAGAASPVARYHAVEIANPRAPTQRVTADVQGKTFPTLIGRLRHPLPPSAPALLLRRRLAPLISSPSTRRPRAHAKR